MDWAYRSIVLLIDSGYLSDYIDYMIATLRESKANLSKLVERASAGEEILITVRGRPKARLVPTPKSDMKAWASELKEWHSKMPVNTSSTEILDTLREDRF